ncbi:MAG: rhodanese-like domain-containing protein [Robiginitomaculum sp.]|nr:rhodanese-like domain-containing protein [Robiginitomaculum sp.]
MNTKLITLIALGALTACSQADAPKAQAQQISQPSMEKMAKPATMMQVTHVNATEAADIIKNRPEVTVIDVRTPREFAAGHIDGAINIDYKNANFAAELAKLDGTKDYLIHCGSGGRSTAALKHFKAEGFSHITHLDGGMIGWNKAGLPTVK